MIIKGSIPMKYTTKLLKVTTALTLSATLFTGVLQAPAHAKAASVSTIENIDESNQYIIQVKENVDVTKIIAKYGGKVQEELPFINGYIVLIPASKEEALKKESGLLKLTKNAKAESQGVQIGQDNLFGKKSVKANTHRSIINGMNIKETGKGVTVAVLDSGMNTPSTEKITTKHDVSINPESTTTFDYFGHGTHVAGIIKGNDTELGVAPASNIINVKLGNDQGGLSEVDLLLGLQWVFDNKDTYNIKVVNLSVSSTQEQSYLNSPISAAVEQLWHNGVTVVTAAGNSLTDTSNVNYPPANDPFIITVGALDGADKIFPSVTKVTEWSKNGKTPEGHQKPEIHAPGVDITSYVPEEALLQQKFPNSVTDKKYMTMSGTSMAAPVVTGAIALMLEANPNLTPDEIKYILKDSAADTLTQHGKTVDVKKAIGLVKNVKYMNDLKLDNYNKFEKSEYINTADNSLDYQKLAWRVHDLEWLKLAWRSVDWAKLAWRSYWEEIGTK